MNKQETIEIFESVLREAWKYGNNCTGPSRYLPPSILWHLLNKAEVLYSRIAPLMEFPEEAFNKAMSARLFVSKTDCGYEVKGLKKLREDAKRLWEGTEVKMFTSEIYENICVPLVRGKRYRLSGASLANTVEFIAGNDIKLIRVGDIESYETGDFMIEIVYNKKTGKAKIKSVPLSVPDINDNKWHHCIIEFSGDVSKGGCPACGGGGNNAPCDSMTYFRICSDCSGTGERRKEKRRKVASPDEK